MVFSTIYRSVWTRLMAAFIVVLVVSPYSEPFATMDGTDFGGAGAVDVGGSAKFKTSAQDALASAPVATVVIDAFVITDRPTLRPMALESRRTQRAILRL
ncbi:MAG TPA: hypothetical protein VKB50_07030 [Vicinamibacterales bacterium]|nr:hypothetical protein [Vicinamibacterales bacterium]